MTYFELNESMPEAERLGGAGKNMEKGLYPPEGVNVISWMSSPDLWRVTITECDTIEQVMRAIGLWRAAAPGLFKLTKTAPAMPVTEIIPRVAEVN